MPTNAWFKTVPELVEPRDRIKEWLVEKFPVCEFSGRQGHDLHEGLIDGNDLKGLNKKPDVVKLIIWKPVLHHPANIGLINHNFHLNRKPNRAQFAEAVLNRPDYFFQEYVLPEWTFKNAENALAHLRMTFETYYQQGLIKTRMSLPL